MTDLDLDRFAERYIAVWNEPEPEARRKQIAELFAADADHYTPSVHAHGHDALEERITKAYTVWVAPGEHYFRAVPGANGHHDSVRFNWEMVRRADEQVISVGFDFITRHDDGLIRTDYQFVDR
jgi:hypothetical protein